MNGAIEVVGASRVEWDNLHAIVVTELHIVYSWCPSLITEPYDEIRVPEEPRPYSGIAAAFCLLQEGTGRTSNVPARGLPLFAPIACLRYLINVSISMSAALVMTHKRNYGVTIT